MNERKIRIPHIDQAETAPPPVFEPFQDRLSRDIRNALSTSLAEAIAEGRPEPFEREAGRLLADRPAERYRTYITDRLPRYHRALEVISQGINDPFAQGVELWNERLFFEMHEVLEHAWYHAEGNRKLLLQAMIRAAGVYVKLEYGYVRQAEKMAGKAREVLEQSRAALTAYFDPQPLIAALAALEPEPPRLNPPGE